MTPCLHCGTPADTRDGYGEERADQTPLCFECWLDLLANRPLRPAILIFDLPAFRRGRRVLLRQIAQAKAELAATHQAVQRLAAEARP